MFNDDKEIKKILIILLHFRESGNMHPDINSTRCYINHTTRDNDDNISNQSINQVFSTATSIYFIFLIIGGVTLNTMLIHIIFTKRRLHTISNSLIVNLSVGDLVTTVITLPFSIDYLLHGHFKYGVFVCGLQETVVMFSLPSSIVNLLLLTAEKIC